jgi:N-acetylglutamate synthase-like GNAT family acetyltransferase
MVEVRSAVAADRDALRPIIEYWVRGRHTGKLLRREVAMILDSVATGHLVAVDGSTVIGLVGLAHTARGVEIVHVFVAPQHHGQGIGNLLVDAVERQARGGGVNELVVRSGPRYQASGWPFWAARYGPPTIEHAKRGDTAEWRVGLPA